jgi:hypothetical protein
VNRASRLVSAPDPGVPDREEVEQAYLLHAADVRRHATRAAQGDRQRAEEATQDAFMAAWHDWASFRLLPPERQRTWLRTRVRWLVIDSWRREAGPELPSDDIPDQPAPETIEDVASSAVTLDRFWKVISAMPERARPAVPPTCAGTRTGRWTASPLVSASTGPPSLATCALYAPWLRNSWQTTGESHDVL